MHDIAKSHQCYDVLMEDGTLSAGANALCYGRCRHTPLLLPVIADRTSRSPVDTMAG